MNRPEPHEIRPQRVAGHPTDAEFDAVIGPGRGITDPRELSSLLRDAERRLHEQEEELRSLRAQIGTHEQGVQTLAMATHKLEQDLASERFLVLRHQRDLDTARYALVRAGACDPLRSAEAYHHGTWQPGRPYLEAEHVYDPVHGRCYRARQGGAPPGQAPPGERWQLCPGPCPAPISPEREDGPLRWGDYAVRQTKLCMTGDGWKPIAEVTDEELAAAVRSCRARADLLWRQELWSPEPRVPTAARAYPDARTWIDRTPLGETLIARARERGIADSSLDLPTSRHIGDHTDHE